jgi:acyl carrier protein phosphodiesterase
MNYLAHAFLAASSDKFLLGSFIGDFVKGSAEGRFDARIVSGIAFHRHVDAFADGHALTRESRRLFKATRRRYAGVIIDICYDHFLSRHWDTYSNEDLEAFINRVYVVLQTHFALLPARLKGVLPRMLAENWLACYRTLEGVDITLKRIAKRISRESRLSDAKAEIRSHYRLLEENFLRFFPDLLAYAQGYPQNDT